MNRPYVTVGVGQQHHAGGVSSPFRRRPFFALDHHEPISKVLDALATLGLCALVILAVALFIGWEAEPIVGLVIR